MINLLRVTEPLSLPAPLLHTSCGEACNLVTRFLGDLRALGGSSLFQYLHDMKRLVDVKYLLRSSQVMTAISHRAGGETTLSHVRVRSHIS